MSCTDCFSGKARDGKPQGKITKLYGLDTYVAEPAGHRPSKGTIIIIPDAFGMPFVNNQLLADNYACKGGYRVYLPDFMRGRSCPTYLLNSMATIMAPGNWFVKLYHIFRGACAFVPWSFFNRPKRTFPLVKQFLEDVRKAEGAMTRLGVAGFCWGGKHTVLLSHQENFVDGTPLLDAGFVGHPSFLEIPRDVDKIAVPISWALADQDHHLTVPQMTDAIATTVENKPDEQKGEVRIYKGCRHGFCVRVDVFSGDTAGFTSQAIEAEDQAIAWFDAKLGGASFALN